LIQKKKKGMWLGPAESSQQRKYGWILHMLWTVFTYTMLLILLLMVIFFRQQILEGARLFWNQLSNNWTRTTGWVLPELQTQLQEQEHNTCLWLFYFFTGVPVAVLCCKLMFSKWPVLAVLVPGVTLTGMLVFRQNMDGACLSLVLAVAVFLLMCSGWEKKKVPGVMVIAGLVLTAVVYVLVTGNLFYKVEEWAAGFSEKIHTAVHEQKYETKDTTLPEGDFSDCADRQDEAVPALVVTMEQPERMYLRGYTGGIFENNRWLPMDTQILAEEKELLYWLNLNGFDLRTQFANAVCSTEHTDSLVTVQNIGACSRYFYVPFSLAYADWLRAEDLNADTLLSEGGRIYTFSAVSGAAKNISQVIAHLLTSQEEQVINYRKAESAYRDFVYSCYLQIPQEAAEMLSEQWDLIAEKHGSGLENLTSEQAQNCVRDFLDKCFTEDGVTDDMDLPLDMAEGSSYQYATVAALTLRYFGIPARYAEGYVITEEMVSGAENGTSIEVGSNCAGAWVEVYQDGIGWIPMELTASLEQWSGGVYRNNTNKETEDGNATDVKTETQETMQEETQSEQTEEEIGGTVVSLPDVVNWQTFLVVLFLLFFLLLCLVIRRCVLLNKKKKRFASSDQRDAIAYLFADTVMLLEKLGFDRGNGSMHELQEPVCERFGTDYAELFHEMLELNARAIFSSRMMEEAQREKALEFYRETLQYLKKDSRWKQRLEMKWIKCLY